MLKKAVCGLAAFLFFFIALGVYQTHFASVELTYAEVQYSIYDVSNQCIADRYSDYLTGEGYVYSSFPIDPECDAVYIKSVKVDIFDTDTPDDSSVKSYKLHGIMLKLGGNGTFMDKILIRQISDGKIVDDMSDYIREGEMEYTEDIIPEERIST